VKKPNFIDSFGILVRNDSLAEAAFAPQTLVFIVHGMKLHREVTLSKHDEEWQQLIQG
jgi:hypothetical protein